MASIHWLRKVVEIQEITMREKRRGMSQQWIYENIIRDQFFISYPTYNRYLTRPAKRELKEEDR